MKLKDITRETLRKKSLWSGLIIVIVAAVVLEGVSLAQLYFSQKGMKEEATKRAEGQLDATRNKVMDIINQTESAVRNSVWIAQWAINHPDSLHRIPERLLKDNPVVVGSTMAMVPGYYPDRHFFSPYSTRDSSGTIVFKSLATPEYNYPEHEWFQKPLEIGAGYWSEPYIDTGGGEVLMTTYSVPVKDYNGRVAAVLTADLSLDWLTQMMGHIEVYPNAISTMISRTGQIMVSPAETLVMRKTVNEYASGLSDDSASLNALNRKMLAGQSGSMSVTHRGQKNLVFFAPIERTGWSMNIFVPESEIYEDLREMKKKISILQLLGLGLIFLILRGVTKNLGKFKDITDKKEKMENELKIASNIQMSMLPKIFPPFPTRKDIDIAATIVPAKEVGGDLYDFFIRDEKLFFCIGDVSGKGVPASLVMAVTRSLFRSVATHDDSPANIVTSINNSMAEMNENNMFVTFICCVLDLHSGHLKYCNAGHNSPLIFTDKIDELPVIPNLPLGVLHGMKYQEQETDMKYDNALFLYTDGLTEAENEYHQLFGMQRLKKNLSGHKSARSHMDNITTAVRNFRGEATQNDDLTMLFVHFLNGISGDIRSVSLTDDIKEVGKLAEFVEKIAEEKHLDKKLTSSINLALEEAVTNVIVYAYKGDKEPEDLAGTRKGKKINVTATLRDKEIEFQITDSGKAFNPLDTPKVDINAAMDNRPIGGLGIHLFRNIMDLVTYSRSNGQNILTLTKKLQ